MRLNFINKILNISDHEWPRVFVSWVITFFLRVGFIVGWTVTIAMFVNRIGIANLPLLFLINASLVIIGTAIYSGLIQRVRREILIVFNILLAALLLISATVFVMYSNWLFFGFVLVAVSIMLAQLNILVSIVVEEFFTPLESQRTFPIVESSETLGTIAGGLIISTFAHAIPSYKFIYIWVLCIMVVIPIILSLKSMHTDMPCFQYHGKRKRSIERIKETVSLVKKSSFLKVLIFVILLQWMFINLLEFQYTKAVQQEVYHETEQTLVYDHSNLKTMKTSLLDLEDVEEHLTYEKNASQYNTMHPIDSSTTGESKESDLTNTLGILQIIFGAVTLLMQLLISSRILKRFGIVNSMAFQPIIAFASLAGMTAKFNMMTSSLAKGTTEMTGLLFKNAYNSSYYAFGERTRDQMKELLEGIVKPIGAIIGMLIVLIITRALSGSESTVMINLLLVNISILSLILIVFLKKLYTQQSKKQYLKRKQHPHKD